VTVTVATTATYGDRFRVVCRHKCGGPGTAGPVCWDHVAARRARQWRGGVRQPSACTPFPATGWLPMRWHVRRVCWLCSSPGATWSCRPPAALSRTCTAGPRASAARAPGVAARAEAALCALRQDGRAGRGAVVVQGGRRRRVHRAGQWAGQEGHRARCAAAQAVDRNRRSRAVSAVHMGCSAQQHFSMWSFGLVCCAAWGPLARRLHLACGADAHLAGRSRVSISLMQLAFDLQSL